MWWGGGGREYTKGGNDTTRLVLNGHGGGFSRRRKKDQEKQWNKAQGRRDWGEDYARWVGGSREKGIGHNIHEGIKLYGKEQKGEEQNLVNVEERFGGGNFKGKQVRLTRQRDGAVGGRKKKGGENYCEQWKSAGEQEAPKWERGKRVGGQNRDSARRRSFGVP